MADTTGNISDLLALVYGDVHETLAPLRKDSIVLAKADCVYLLSAVRRAPHTTPALWKLSGERLAAMAGAVSAAEEAQLAELRRRRDDFGAAQGRRTADQLKTDARAASLPVSVGITRDGLLDLLAAERPAEPEIVLDEDQRAVVERQGQAELFLHAGPGSGKTTVVCAATARIVADDPEARILVLVFNTAARDTLVARLRRARAALIPKRGVRDHSTRGIAVLTFDEFGFQVNAGAAPAYSADDAFEAEMPPAANIVVEPVPVSSEAAQGLGGYRREFDRACAASGGSLAVGGWTHLVLDEAQDICAPHAAMIEAILRAEPPPRLFAAGDPRQEIYPGAVWFSRQLAAKPAACAALRFNHRAAPELVAALNAYSRAAFPALHIDQIAVRPPGGRAFAVQSPDLARCGAQVGEALASAAPGAAFAVAPVTVKKWSQESATLAARQCLHELRPGDEVAVLDGDARAAGGRAYQLATARKIKGQERDLVVVYGLGADYSNMIAKPLLAKLVYVAISRARDVLCLALPSRASGGGARDPHRSDRAAVRLLAPVIALCGLAPPPRAVPSPLEPMLVVPVADREEGLSGLEGLRVIFAPRDPPFPPLTAGALNDPDFVGLYLEAALAHSLGAPTMRPGNTRFVPTADRGKWGFSIEGEGWVVRASQASCHNLERAAAEARAAAGVGTTGTTGAAASAYYSTAIRYTVQAGRAWTVSERLLDADSARILEANAARLATAVRAIGAGVAGAAPVHGVTLSYPVHAHRAPPDAAPAALVRYNPDLVFRCARCAASPTSDASCPSCAALPVFELKHARGGLSATHRRQAGVYAALLGRPSCVLLNLADGLAETVTALPLASVVLHARAVVCLRTAHSLRLRIVEAGKRGVRFEPPAPVLIAVDVETDGKGLYTEIGAVAFVAGSHEIVGAFHVLAPGTAPAPDGDGLYETGLVVTDPDALEDAQESLEKQYHAWAASVSDACTLLHWGGGEKALQRTGDHPVDALHKIFRPWLSANNGDSRRDRCRLADAAEQFGVPPEGRPVPHRAFEDALLTLMVYVAAVDPDGAL